MFYQPFFVPQVRRWVIITYKHDIYEFPHELSNDLWFRILRMFAAGRAFVPTQEKKDLRKLGNSRKI